MTTTVLTEGTLQETDLASLLQAMHLERATGTLSLENGSGKCSLYFLFGHLFHAAGRAGNGEDVVLDALGWDQGNFGFDPRAKLPAEETIKSSPAELIAKVARRDEDAAGGTVAADPMMAATLPSADHGSGWNAKFAPSAADNAPVPNAAADSTPSLRYSPYDAGSEPPPEVSGWWSGRGGHGRDAPTVNPAATPHPEPVVMAPVPLPVGASAPPLDAPGVAAVFYPLPDGRRVYHGLKSAFVDFPKLLRTLRVDGHTGYVTLAGDNFSGALILRDGRVLEALVHDGDGPSQRELAFLKFRRAMDSDSRLLDVVELEPDCVAGIHRLITAPALYTDLLGRFVNFDALLEYLGEEHVNGAVVVVAESQMGVILLRDGAVVGSYTESAPHLDGSTAGVAALARERLSRIQVNGGDAPAPAIDVEAALAKP